MVIRRGIRTARTSTLRERSLEITFYDSGAEAYAFTFG
jgi:hypothetical protein